MTTEYIFHDDMVCWCAAEKSTESHVGREDVVGDPDKDRIWMVSHIVVIRLEQVGLEKGVLKTAWEALDNEVTIERGEKGLEGRSVTLGGFQHCLK